MGRHSAPEAPAVKPLAVAVAPEPRPGRHAAPPRGYVPASTPLLPRGQAPTVHRRHAAPTGPRPAETVTVEGAPHEPEAATRPAANLSYPELSARQTLGWTGFAVVIAWSVMTAGGRDAAEAAGWATGAGCLVPAALAVRGGARIRANRSSSEGDQ
jgi:hypothetical protein